ERFQPAAGRHGAGGEPGPPDEPELVVLSAPDAGALARLVRSWLDWLTPAGVGGAGAPAVEALRARVAELAGVGIDEVDPDACLADFGLGRPGLAAIGSLLTEWGGAPARISDLDSTIRQLAGGSGGEAIPTLRDIAFTLQVGRRALPARLALVVADRDDLRARLARFVETGDAGDAGCRGAESGEAAPDPE